MPLRVVNGALFRVGNSLVTNDDCCCGCAVCSVDPPSSLSPTFTGFVGTGGGCDCTELNGTYAVPHNDGDLCSGGSPSLVNFAITPCPSYPGNVSVSWRFYDNAGNTFLEVIIGNERGVPDTFEFYTFHYDFGPSPQPCSGHGLISLTYDGVTNPTACFFFGPTPACSVVL